MADVRLPDGTIVRNVPEGITKAQLMARVRRTSAPKTEEPSLLGSTAATLIGAGQGLTANFLPRIGAAFGAISPIPAEGVSNIWQGKPLSEAYSQNLEALNRSNTQRARQYPVATTLGNIAGSVAPIMAGGAAVPLRAAAGASMPARVAQVAKAVAPSAAYGALAGAGTSRDLTNAPETLQNMVIGAGTGIAGELTGRGLAAGLGRAISGPSVSPEVRKLAEAGVIMTPGQRRGGMLRDLESKLTGVLPFAGDVMAAQQRQGVKQFSRATVDKTLAPIGAKLPSDIPAGTKAVDYASKKIGSVYDDVLTRMRFQQDDVFSQNIDDLVARVQGGGLADPQVKQFENIFQNWVARKVNPETGAMDGETLKNVSSELGRLGNKYARSQDGSQAELGDAILELLGEVKGAAARVSDPADAAKLASADEAWANFVRVRGASATAARKGGEFGPGDLMTAIRVADKSIGKGSTARGEALMQDWAQAGQSVLPSTVPDSGTAARWAIGGAPLAGGAYFEPTTALGVGALTVPYLPGVRNVLQNMAIRPQGMVAAGEAVGGMAPQAGRLGAGYTISDLYRNYYTGEK